MKLHDALRQLPAVHELAASCAENGADSLPRALINELARDLIESERERLRGEIKNGVTSVEPQSNGREDLQTQLRRTILEFHEPQLRPAINATGVIVHTGMGRAPLPEAAVEAIAATAPCYSDVAIDRRDGGRRNRSSIVEPLLRALTGCEAALVANNNAAATMLALAALAKNKEVVVSRGQLVEIGGSFRLPDVMQFAGCRLREVGTTNRTRIEDYEHAIGEETGALMRIHPSNYRIVGFTESASLEALVSLGAKHHLPVIDDIGSGALIDLSHYGLMDEPLIRDSVAAGADLTLFSGDKLLGGPQAGILVGKTAAIDACAKNPLMRALRVDKLTIAALEATLRLYLEPESLAEKLPTLRMITESAECVKRRATRTRNRVKKLCKDATISIEPGVSYVGGGSLPDQELTTSLLVYAGEDAERVRRQLREGSPSIYARVRRDRLELDLRTVADGEVAMLAKRLAEITGQAC